MVDSLQNLRIASPCPASWEQLQGDDRVRFCSGCELWVYNLSAMSEKEAKKLVEKREGRRLCVMFYQRSDGTVLTQDCPKGVKRVALRLKAAAVASVAVVLAWLSLPMTNSPDSSMTAPPDAPPVQPQSTPSTGERLDEDLKEKLRQLGYFA